MIGKSFEGNGGLSPGEAGIANGGDGALISEEEVFLEQEGSSSECDLLGGIEGEDVGLAQEEDYIFV